MMNFKICQIGCGAMSERGHGPALMKYAKDYPGAILAGCCDLDENRAKSFKSTFGLLKEDFFSGPKKVNIHSV